MAQFLTPLPLRGYQMNRMDKLPYATLSYFQSHPSIAVNEFYFILVFFGISNFVASRP